MLEPLRGFQGTALGRRVLAGTVIYLMMLTRIGPIKLNISQQAMNLQVRIK